MDELPELRDGIICTAEEFSRSLVDASIFCLTRAQSIGLTLIAETGLISFLAVLLVFGIIIRNITRHIRNGHHEQWHMIQEPMDLFMLSLFTADLLQAMGAAMDIKWIRDGKVESGHYCTAQGAIQQLGETGVGMSTLVIAVYTFIGVWWRKGIGAVLMAQIIVGLVWTFIILMVVLGNAIHPGRAALYESPTPYWCWIGEGYLQWRIWGEYIWFWITLAFSFLAYIPLFFWSRGNITVDEDSWWKFHIHHSSHFDDPSGRRRRSLTMIAYPLVYSILVLPLSVVRWIGFVQERGGKINHIGSAATIGVTTVYGLSGLFNVILLMTTRPNSILFGSRFDYNSHRAPSPASVPYKPDDRLGSRNDLHLGRLPSRSSGWET